MKTRFTPAVGIVLLLNMALSAMVIHNYACAKDDGIRTESGVFNEDYLFLGNELKFSGEAEDLVFLGKRLTFSGETKLGLISLCERLIYTGTSGNGIIAGAMDILLDGTVNSNSFIGCKNFTLGDMAVVNGNLFIGCARLIINGKLNGDLYTGAGEVVINSEIQGNVTAYGGRVTIGDKGKINGNLVYSAKEKLSEQELARVAGTVKINDRIRCKKEDWTSFRKYSKSIGFLIGLGLFISFVVVGSLLLAFSGV